MPTIRPVLPGDVRGLLAIQAAAEKTFRSIEMPEVADDPLPDPEQLAHAAWDGPIAPINASAPP